MAPSQSSISAAPDDHTPAAAATSSDGGGVLPLRLVREVLLRLPAKPLCRLRCVCRSWRSLLSDPAFVAAHASLHPGPLFAVGVVVATSWGKTMRVDMVDASGRLVNRVPAGWWHGHKAMLRTDHHLAAVAVDDKCLRLRVANLATGVVSFVPTRLQERGPHPSPGGGGAPRDGAAARKPPHRFTGLVLGRAASGEHKAVRVRGDLADQTCEVVTILRDGDGDSDGDGGRARWRERQAPPAELLFWTPEGFPDGAVVDGTAYFLVDPRGRLGGRDPYGYGYTLGDFAEGGIACFDLAAEEWWPRLLGGPPSTATQDHTSWNIRKSHVSLAALNGRLVVVHRNDDDDRESKTLDLWFRTESEDGTEEAAAWSRRYAIPYDAIMPRDGDREAEPLWVMADGRVAVWVWGSSSTMEDDGRQGLLRMYDPADGKCVDVFQMSNCIHIGAYTGGMLSEYQISNFN